MWFFWVMSHPATASGFLGPLKQLGFQIAEPWNVYLVRQIPWYSSKSVSLLIICIWIAGVFVKGKESTILGLPFFTTMEPNSQENLQEITLISPPPRPPKNVWKLPGESALSQQFLEYRLEVGLLLATTYPFSLWVSSLLSHIFYSQLKFVPRAFQCILIKPPLLAVGDPKSWHISPELSLAQSGPPAYLHPFYLLLSGGIPGHPLYLLFFTWQERIF